MPAITCSRGHFSAWRSAAPRKCSPRIRARAPAATPGRGRPPPLPGGELNSTTSSLLRLDPLRDLLGRVLVGKGELDRAKAGVRGFGEPFEKRHLGKQEREVGGEAGHRCETRHATRTLVGRRARAIISAEAKCARGPAVRNGWRPIMPTVRTRSSADSELPCTFSPPATDARRVRHSARRRTCRAPRDARAALAARAHGVRRRRALGQGGGVPRGRRPAAARQHRGRSCAPRPFLRETGARRLVVLGDFLHAAAGRVAALDAR